MQEPWAVDSTLPQHPKLLLRPAMCETRRRAAEGPTAEDRNSPAALPSERSRGTGARRRASRTRLVVFLRIGEPCVEGWMATGPGGGARKGFLSERWYREAPCRSQGPLSTG